MATVTKGDIKLVPKTGKNFGNGHLDWDVDAVGNVTVLTDPSSYLLQALFKSVLSKMNSSGYGVDIGAFLGTKHVVPMRAGLAMRLFRTSQVISQWYQRSVTISKLQMSLGSQRDTFQLQLGIAEKSGEILISST